MQVNVQCNARRACIHPDGDPFGWTVIMNMKYSKRKLSTKKLKSQLSRVDQ